METAVLQNRMTITEALADIVTTAKRVAKRRQSIMPYLARVNSETDPIRDNGGSAELIRREMQGIADLEGRIVALRMAVQKANQVETISIGTTTRTIAEWLTWRKEILPERKRFLSSIQAGLVKLRSDAKNRQVGLINVDAAQAAQRSDILVNISESELINEADQIELIEGMLDGQLSLKNATIVIEV